MTVEKIKAEVEVFEDRFNRMKLLTIKCLEKIQVSLILLCTFYSHSVQFTWVSTKCF